MMWKNEVYRQLRSQHLFENEAHQSRFKELLDCYSNASFFTPGLCKCMYLSCWDEEHFLIMLDMLNQLKLKDHMTLTDMKENGQLMAEEMSADNYEATVMQLSCDFLSGTRFDPKKLSEIFDPTGRHIIEQALKASAVIDSIPRSNP